MLEYSNIELTKQGQITNMTGIRLLSVIIFLGCVAVSATFGQTCSGNPATYSDMWIWSTGGTSSNGEIVYDEENPPVTYIAGTGYIYDPYNSCGHEYYVDSTEIQSPSGRIATGSNSADLIFDENDLGNYSVSNNYLQFCPIIYQFYSAGFSTITIGIGSSFNTYRKGVEAPGEAVYFPIRPCDTTCLSERFTIRNPRPPISEYIRVAEPYLITYFGRICSPIASRPLRISTPIACADAEIEF